MNKIFKAAICSVLLTTAISVFGQENSGLEIVKHEWKPNFRESTTTSRSMTADPQRYPVPDLMKNQDGTTSINPDSRRVNPEGGPEPVNPTVLPPQRAVKALLELKNNSPKGIDSLEADYILYDRDKKEYLRYRLVSGKDIKPGETVKIKKTVTADDLKQFSGKATPATVFFVTPASTAVELVTVKYADGSVWTKK